MKVTGPSLPWGRIIAEGAAIVLSILLAFAIQAWWEGRGESDRRAAILAGLASDFARTDSVLNRSLMFDSFRAEGTARLIELARTETDFEAHQAEIDTLISTVYFRSPIEPARGTLDALLSTGDLDILGNPALAARLTSWIAAVEHLGFQHDRVVRRVTQMDDFLQRHVLVENFLFVPFETDYGPPWELEHTDGWRMLEDVEFRGIISNLWYDTDASIDYGRRVSTDITEIRALIDAEIAR